MLRGAETVDDEGAFDPLSDIFFSAIAILFVALISVGPLISQTSATRKLQGASSARDRVTYDGRELPLILATAAGVRIEGAESEVDSLDQIQTAPRLKAAIDRAAQTSDARLLLMIEPGGGEAAFLLEPILAAAQIRSVVQVRLLRGCGDAMHPDWLRTCLSDRQTAEAP